MSLNGAWKKAYLHMKKPNQELFRILRFAIRFPGWHSYASDVNKHVNRAEALGLLEVNRQTKQFKLFSGLDISDKPVIKVHWINHWPEAIPVLIEELAECHAGLNQLWGSPTGSFLLTKEKILEYWQGDGDNLNKKVDAYILPQPSGHHDIGIRFGNKIHEYLSPHGDKEKVQALLDKYKQ